VPAYGSFPESPTSPATASEHSSPHANRAAEDSSPRPLGQADKFESIEKEISMNKDTIEGNWKQLKGKVKEQWGKLTDDDFDVIAGKRDQLLGRIQERHGVSRDEAEKQIKDWEVRDGRTPAALWYEKV
jgi:uncharacterized protein YjbJ (UPF0337 family)